MVFYFNGKQMGSQTWLLPSKCPALNWLVASAALRHTLGCKHRGGKVVCPVNFRLISLTARKSIKTLTIIKPKDISRSKIVIITLHAAVGNRICSLYKPHDVECKTESILGKHLFMRPTSGRSVPTDIFLSHQLLDGLLGSSIFVVLRA